MMSPDNRHKLALPYWARPGLVTFAAAADAGGADDDAADDDDDEDEDEDDEADDPDEGKSPEELAAELKAARAAIQRANGSSAKRRRTVKALKARIAELEAATTGGKPKTDDDAAPDLEAVRKAAAREATSAAHERIAKAEARGALKALGVKPERVSQLVRLLDFDEIDVDDDGEVDGLDDAIESLKAEYPELFPTSTRRRRSVSGVDDRDGERGKAPRETDASKLQAAALLGRK